MTTYTCPKGHASSDSDFCSDCGARIGGPAVPSQTPVSQPDQPIKCPDCGTVHVATAIRFCEVCGYNFETGGHGEAPPIHPSPEPKLAWEVMVTVDPSLRSSDSPDAPANQPPVQIELTKESSLIGRRSVARAIEPDIALDQDAAVSHRHALLLLQPDQSLALRDIGSSNGTALNGAEVQPMTDTPLKDGDQITLGHWTRLVVRAVQAN